MSTPILILGASGWVGHYLAPLLVAEGKHVIAAYANRIPVYDCPTRKLHSGNLDALTELSAAHVVNLSRGETEAEFRFHQALIAFTNEHDTRYLFASSFNAVDAELARPHQESDPANAQSDYGKFKVRCEEELLRFCKRPLAFRFPAVHGWAPNRVARTEHFLQRLAAGEQVPVQTGIVQNRLFVGDLARLIAHCVQDEDAEGVFHFGAADASEELEFLRALAEAFGYRGRVIPGEANPCNAVMVPEKLRKRGVALPSEADAIARVRAQPELAKYAYK